MKSGSRKVVARIKGGIGNQLFCYAAARRLALLNDAELVIDDVTGFIRDSYQRRYALHHFHVAGRRATPKERLEPFERYRRGFAKLLSRQRPFEERSYLEQFGSDFENRLLTLRIANGVYLDGYWQSEGYFKDKEETIRSDLQIVAPSDIPNLRIADTIRSSNSVALHVRWFDAPHIDKGHNASVDYYRKAIAFMDASLGTPRYFLFSDDPQAACSKLDIAAARVECVSHNTGDENAYADLWLMSQCRHFITANSTFSWWGAWLGVEGEKLVVTPAMTLSQGTITSWNLPGQIPDDWIRM